MYPRPLNCINDLVGAGRALGLDTRPYQPRPTPAVEARLELHTIFLPKQLPPCIEFAVPLGFHKTSYSSGYLCLMLAIHIPSRALVGPRKTYDRTLRMDFITTVTAVTKIQRYPLRSHTTDTHQSGRVCPHHRSRPPCQKVVTTVTVMMAAYLGGMQLCSWIPHNRNSSTTRTQGWSQEQSRRL